jgi:phosphatidylglycerophosphate synthase
MFDAKLRPLIDPPLNALGRALARIGVSADALTLAGAATGAAAGFAIAEGVFGLALGLIALSRMLDGLDGAVARATRLTDFGGYLDIVADLVFYCAIPLGFAAYADENAFPAATLLASFALTGITFLSYAAVAARRGATTDAHGKKSIFYSTGLAEGAETIAVFVAMCVIPGAFVLIAFAYAGLCVLTVLQRTMLARRDFR